jgi:hypothetical protein
MRRWQRSFRVATFAQNPLGHRRIGLTNALVPRQSPPSPGPAAARCALGGYAGSVRGYRSHGTT